MADDKALAERREALVRLRDELMRALEQGKESARTVELDQSSVGRLSRMDAVQGQAMGVEAQRRRELALSRTRSALRRIEDGTYGDCLMCGEPVATRRLDHDPAAPTCVECARSSS